MTIRLMGAIVFFSLITVMMLVTAFVQAAANLLSWLNLL